MSKSTDKRVSQRKSNSKGRDEEQSSPAKSLRSRVGSDDELPSTMFNFNFKKKKSDVSNQSNRSRNVSGTSLKSSQSKTKSPQKVTKSPQKVRKVIGPGRKKTSTTNDKNGGPESSSSNTTSRKTHPSFLASLITDDEDDNEEHENTPITKISPRKNGRSVREESVTTTMSVSSHSDQEIDQRQIMADKSNTEVVPSKTNGPTVLAVMVDRNYSEYSLLSNSHAKPYIKVPINSPALNYAFPTDYQFEEVDPGVFISISFDFGTVKTGILRIAPRTVKPFEQTTTSHICLAVVEGCINVKSSSFEFDEKGEPVLKSIQLLAGSHITIPNNSLYTVENLIDEECCIYYCIIQS